MGVARIARTVLDVTTVLVVIPAALLVIWKLGFAESTSTRPSVQRVEERSGVIDAGLATNVLGDGPLAIVEFSDFECPFCAMHARSVLPQIKERLIDPGRARYIMMHFPLDRIHPLAMKAAEAAECSMRQGQFWAMHDRLFAAPSALGADQLEQAADAIGLDGEAFRTCLASGETAQRVRGYREVGRSFGITGTPAFLLGTVREDGAIVLRRLLRGRVSVYALEQHLVEIAQQPAASTFSSRLR